MLSTTSNSLASSSERVVVVVVVVGKDLFRIDMPLGGGGGARIFEGRVPLELRRPMHSNIYKLAATESLQQGAFSVAFESYGRLNCLHSSGM